MTHSFARFASLLVLSFAACSASVASAQAVCTDCGQVQAVAYVEEKGNACGSHGHRRNHTIAAERLAVAMPLGVSSLISKAS